jgi:RNA polymerase sigma factor (sigma-70 family)
MLREPGGRQVGTLRKPVKPNAPREFEELLTEHLDGLYSGALRFCSGRSADAEDLLQDAVFRAVQHFDDLRDPAAARAWFYTILARTNLNRLRTRCRRAETFAPVRLRHLDSVRSGRS